MARNTNLMLDEYQHIKKLYDKHYKIVLQQNKRHLKKYNKKRHKDTFKATYKRLRKYEPFFKTERMLKYIVYNEFEFKNYKNELPKQQNKVA